MKRHVKGACPENGKQCCACKKWDHFKDFCTFFFFNFCRYKNPNNVEVSEDLPDTDLFIDIVESHLKKKWLFFAEMEIVPSKQKFIVRVDTGSQVNILPLYAFQQLGVKTALKTVSGKQAYGNPHLLFSTWVRVTRKPNLGGSRDCPG